MTLGNRIRLLRQEKGLTQAQFGNCFNLAESTISLYESGKRSPDYDVLKKFATFFDVTIDFLLGHTSQLNPSTFKEESPLYLSSPHYGYLTETPCFSAVKLQSSGIVYEPLVTEHQPSFQEATAPKHYWLLVQDDSLRGDGIYQGDLVLVREQSSLPDGAIGLVLTEQETGRLYRVYQKEDGLFLLSSNAAFPPLYYPAHLMSKVTILGRCIELCHSLA